MLYRIFILILASTLLFTPSFATTINVRQDGSGDYLAIASALNAAQSGDIIDVGPGTYTESLTVSKNVTLQGAAMAGQTILDGQNSFRPMHVDGPYHVTIRSFQFQNGFGDQGSALLIWGTPNVLVEDCLFIGNHAYESNALHIRHTGTHVVVRDCEFRNNTAQVKSAAIGIGIGGYLLLEDSIIADNSANVLCGAVNCTQATMDVRGCLFLRNSSPNTGAIVYSEAFGLISNNTFYENSGAMNGTVYADWATVFRQNVVANDLSGVGLTAYGVMHSGNLYFNNASGPIAGELLGPDESQADPLFCDAGSDIFTLCSISPALAIVNGYGLMGAFDQGCTDCGPVVIEEQSWGSIKAMFR